MDMKTGEFNNIWLGFEDASVRFEEARLERQWVETVVWGFQALTATLLDWGNNNGTWSAPTPRDILSGARYLPAHD